MSKTSHPSSKPFKAWIICLTAALGLFFIFFQMHAFNSLSNNLMQSFNINESQLGIFSTIYLLSGGLSLIPVSFLIDRFSVKKAIVIGMVLAIASSSIFAISHSIILAGFARMLGGISQSFVFLGCLRLVAKWLQKQLALANSTIITIGLMGAVAAQTPLTLMIAHFGWRYSLLIISVLTLVVSILIIFIVQDKQDSPAQKAETQTWSELLTKLKNAALFSQNWLCSAYTTFLNLPIIILGGLLGNIYLQGAEQLSKVQASSIITLMYFGSMLGGPIIGWLSDRMGKRRPLMLFFPGLAIISVGLICFLTGLSFIQLSALLAYPILTECNPSKLANISMGFACMISILFNAFFQSTFASLIQSNIWSSLAFNPLDPYRSTMLLFALVFAAGLLVTFFIKETYCGINKQ
ncbi:MAG: phtD [Gammaproteobacteria bacterium]|nr:phtD [Gammaproteobacteria bacterium]